MIELNETHDPARRSWVESANSPASDFPIQNLPFGIFETGGRSRCGVAVGDFILDLEACSGGAIVSLPPGCSAPVLNDLMAAGPESRAALRLQLSRLLEAGNKKADLVRNQLIPMSDARMQLPAAIGDYTDFYAGIHHATRVGALFRPDNPLLPNYKHVPIAYHGRSSSIVPSGTPVARPNGQIQNGDEPPRYGPSQRLDYELEVGMFIGPGNPLGRPIPISRAEEHIFGLCLVNDWSARDIQKWEYQPLGPFLAKSFTTTISPWIVTLEALAPFRCPSYSRLTGDPEPLPYLSDPRQRESGGIDLALEVRLATERMRLQNTGPVALNRVSFREMYWTPGQMVAHHTSNGCNLRPGDLLASGTVSGPEANSGGCLLELTQGGKHPIGLPTGEQRRFLEDGDEVWLSGRCSREGFISIGFGECRGIILPALV